MRFFKKWLEEIPQYTSFRTVDEMDDHSRELASRYPDLVEVMEIGRSKNGHPMLCLKIGKGKENLLFYGCPHPNEPIGSLMLEYLSEKLVKDFDFLNEFNYTFYIVKTVDPDGTKLNEGWFNGPVTLKRYAMSFYRPPSEEQTDWNFPIEYKTLSFMKPTPEASALMDLIEATRPVFIYPLHNAGFGGTYWYLNHEMKEIHEDLMMATKKAGIPANIGAPEMPYIESFAPGIYRMVGVRQMYDHAEKHAPPGVDPADSIKNGSSSVEYAEGLYEPYSVITEVPYFLDQKISDMTLVNKTRREIVLTAFDYQKKTVEFMKTCLDTLEPYVDKSENPFYRSVRMYFRIPEMNDNAIRMMEDNSEYDCCSTIAESFDYTVKSKFYMGILPLGTLVRLCRFEKSLISKESKLDKLLSDIESIVVDRIDQMISEIDEELDYQMIPIKDMIAVQLETGLIVIDYLIKQRENNPEI